MFWSVNDSVVRGNPLGYLNLNDPERVWVWAHGELESLLRHDHIVCDSIFEYNTMRGATRAKPEKFMAIVKDRDGAQHVVLVYTWRPISYVSHAPNVRGLVVLNTDELGQEFAQMHMDNRSEHL